MSEIITVQDLEILKKHEIFESEVLTGKVGGLATGADIDYATNAATGQVQKTMPAILRDIGFSPAPFTFATGGTLNAADHDLAVYNPAPNGDNNWYSWGGPLPKTIAPNSTPQTSGGFGANAWIQKTDNVLKPSVLEALRRSYAFTGYYLVSGSFEQGGVLTSPFDILLHEASGIGYSGAGPYPQTVVAGTNPSAGGFTDRSLVRPGAGVIRDGRFALRDIICVADMGVVGDGSNEKVNIQKAIDYASGLGGYVELLFEPGKTYVSAGLTPKSGVLIDLQGSTLKLNNAANTPVFFDGGAGNGKNFGVINGTIDCNQTNNNGINVLGGVWLTGWSGLRFDNLDIKNCPRIGLNLVGCSYLKIDGYRFSDSGMGATFFAYALNIEKGSGVSRYISVKNVAVSNVIGFGVHFFGCADYEADNLSFFNLTWGSTQAIAVTFTNTQRGSCNNVICNLVGGDNIEVNGNSDLTLENYTILQAGNRALLTGGLSYGYNQRVRIRNFTSASTDGAFSAALTYLTDCELDGVVFDKPISTTLGLTLQKGNVVRNSTIGSTVSASPAMVAYGYFKLENVSFTDYTFRQLNSQGAVVSGFQTPVAIGATINLPFPAIFSVALMSSQGSIAGTLKTLTRYTQSLNQGSYQTCSFLVNDFGTAANISAITQVNNTTTRALTITGDAANKQLVLTNGSGVDLGISWTLEATFFI